MGSTTILVIFSVALSLLTDTILCQRCGFNDHWVGYQGRCYWASKEGPDDLVNYTTAVQKCEDVGARTECDEDDYGKECADIHHGIRQYWIGLEQNPPVSESETIEDRRANWTWTDGSLYTWSNWYEGAKVTEHEPSGGGGRVRLLHSGTWADTEEVEAYQFICKTQIGVIPRTTTRSTSIRTSSTTTGNASSSKGQAIETTVTSSALATVNYTASSLFSTSSTLVIPAAQAGELDMNAYIGIGAGIAAFIVVLVIIIMVVVIYRRKHAGKSLAQGDYYNTRNGAAPPDENMYNEIDGPGYAEVGGKPGTAPAHSHNPRPASTHSAAGPLPGHTIAPTGVEYATVDKSRKTSNKSRQKSSADEETTVVDNNIYAPSLDCIMR